MVELCRWLLHLLTQKVKSRDFFGAGVIRENMNVVADRVSGPKCVDAPRDEKIFRCDPLKHFLRIIEKFARLFADLWIIENRRVTATQFPRMKKRRPVDVFDQNTHRE